MTTPPRPTTEELAARVERSDRSDSRIYFGIDAAAGSDRTLYTAVPQRSGEPFVTLSDLARLHAAIAQEFGIPAKPAQRRNLSFAEWQREAADAIADAQRRRE